MDWKTEQLDDTVFANDPDEDIIQVYVDAVEQAASQGANRGRPLSRVANKIVRDQLISLFNGGVQGQWLATQPANAFKLHAIFRTVIKAGGRRTILASVYCGFESKKLASLYKLQFAT